MKILVFGGTGAMGTPLVRRLAERGDDVYVTSRRERCSDGENVHYIKGNAQSQEFVREILKDGYDVLVDFMNYSTTEFQQRANGLLSSVGQYIFMSSCRVYAPSENAITEESPRLLDVCQDLEYMTTKEYALSKALEEDLLKDASHTNWTIVRPGLTYNAHRLQLGSYELEHWLYRLLHGRTLVFSEDLMGTHTPMTYGDDTAYAIAGLVGNERAYGETIQISTPETMRWGEIMSIYLEVLTNKRGGGIAQSIYG